jgi:hypothetical protein
MGNMESRSRLFGSALQFCWRLGVGLVFFCAASSVFMAGVGWLNISLPPWTAGVAGLLIALLFDRVAKKNLDASSFQVWSHVPVWQLGAVLGVFTLVLAAVAYFLLTTFSVDPLCHHGITNSILAFGAPARDLGAPDRFLPYHALGNLLAATLASAIKPADPSSAVEISLDIVSLGSLAVFLAIVSVFFVLLLPVFDSSRRPGPLWLCFIYVLLVFGAGPAALAHLMPDVLESADCYPEFAALTFHPLLQYLGRRSAVPAFAIFVVFLCVLLLSSKGAFARRWIPWAILTACFVALAYSSLDMFIAAVLLLLTALFLRNLRGTVVLGLGALAVAIPFVIFQGGFLTASFFNVPLPEAKSFFAWELRAPSLVGFFRGHNLAGVSLSELFAWKVLAVEFPWFLLSIPTVGGLLSYQKPSARRAWVFLLLVLSTLMLAVPFFVFFVFSPWDLHRLFFWPTLFAAMLTPIILVHWTRSRAVLSVLVAVLLTISCGSALMRIFLREPSEQEALTGRTSQEFRARLGFDPQHDKTWVASAGAQSLLFMNGCRVLATPFGTAGPVYYVYPPLLLDALVQNRLAASDTGGANMALLTADDLAFLRENHRGEIEVLKDFELFNDTNPLRVFVVRLGDAENHVSP